MVAVANGAGTRTAALITDMNEPLASAAGNAVEIRNAIDFLTGRPSRSAAAREDGALGEALLVLAGAAPNLPSGRAVLEQALDNGAATERFGKMVAALGGPADFLDRPDSYLAAGPPLCATSRRRPKRGVVAANRSPFAIGHTVIALGGGRSAAPGELDRPPGSASTGCAGLGTTIAPGNPACPHLTPGTTTRPTWAKRVSALALSALARLPPAHPLIVERLGAGVVR